MKLSQVASRTALFPEDNLPRLSNTTLASLAFVFALALEPVFA